MFDLCCKLKPCKPGYECTVLGFIKEGINERNYKTYHKIVLWIILIFFRNCYDYQCQSRFGALGCISLGLSIRTGITMVGKYLWNGAGNMTACLEKSSDGEHCLTCYLLIILDILMLNHLVPVFQPVILKLIMMLLGMFVIGVASYFYISTGFGSGPRDGLMVVLTKKTGKSVRFVRNSIELSVLVIGYVMGGSVGIGTAIMAVATGFFVQFSFKLFKYDLKETKHRFIDEDIKRLYDKFFRKKKEETESQ